MAYTLYEGSPDFKKTTASTAITNSTVNVNGGTIMSPGADGSKVDTVDLVRADQSLYGSQIIVTEDITGYGTASGANVSPVLRAAVKLTNVILGDSDSDKIHSIKAVRTRQVTSAIRAGHWDIYSGEFSTAPTGVNDFVTFAADQEVAASTNGRGLKGQFTFATQAGPINDDYDPRTN